MKKIPHLLTCLNLLTGCIALVQILKFANYKMACMFIFIACIFDFLDGLAANLLRATSLFGKELDSLSDIISFGLVPSCMIYSFLSSGDFPTFIPYCSFLLVVFVSLRLARFNLDNSKKIKFVGLPVPACCLFWAGLIPILPKPNYILLLIILILIVIFCFLMVSSYPMFSLKLKNFYNNRYPFILLVLACLFVGISAIFNIPFFGLSLTIIVYIYLSLYQNKKKGKIN